MDWMKTARIVFAVTMIGVGLMGLASGGFAAIWAGAPKTLPNRELLAYVTDAIALGCGAGLVVKRTAAASALLVLVALILWTALFKIPFILRAPLVEGGYQSSGENFVLIAAAWVLFARSATGWKGGLSAVIGGPFGLRLAYLLYGLALIAFGLSHFFYLNLTAPLVPEWLPSHVFWAYFTGALYLATGLAIVSGVGLQLGAVLSAAEITTITFLVWGPMVLAGHMSQFNQQETTESWALTAAAWVVAASVQKSGGFARRAIAGRRGQRIAPAR